MFGNSGRREKRRKKIKGREEKREKRREEKILFYDKSILMTLVC
jgi:hypothetical protein